MPSPRRTICGLLILAMLLLDLPPVAAFDVGTAAQKEMQSLGKQATQIQIEVASERALLEAMAKSGVKTISRVGRKNGIDYDVAVSMDVAKNLPGNWKMIGKSFQDIIDSFAYHYQKHGVKEMKAVGKEPISQLSYYQKSIETWKTKGQSAEKWSLGDGSFGKKIFGDPGGIYTNDGQVVTFWVITPLK